MTSARRLIAPTLATAWLAAQPPTLVVRVRDEVTGRPLPNAEVVDVGTGASRLTDARGEVRLTRSPGLRVRVRQIGFQFAERDVPQDADTLTVVLRHVAYTLGPVVTHARVSCDSTVDTLAARLAAPALEQLRLGAGRYDEFRRAYPFRVTVERRTVHPDRDGTVHRVLVQREETTSERWDEPYRPGRVVERTSVGFSVPILFVSALADQRFWDRHCFAALGTESLAGRRVVRLTFTPARGVRDAEWEGVAFVDSASSLLRRVEFRLANLLEEGGSPSRLEGFITFSSPSPYVAMPESTLALWWRDPPSHGEWGTANTLQLLHVVGLKYRKASPPEP